MGCTPGTPGPDSPTTSTTSTSSGATTTTVVGSEGLVIGAVAPVPGSPGGAYLYYPSETPSSRLIVFVHGGQGSLGSIWELPWWTQGLTGEGWHVASVDYRRMTATPAAASDVADSIRHLSSTLGIDGQDIVLFGHSLGAHPASLVAYGANSGQAFGTEVGAYVALAPVHQLWGLANASYFHGEVVIRDILRCNPGVFNTSGYPDCRAEWFLDAEPLYLIDSGDPPTFVGVFDSDFVVPPSVGGLPMISDLTAAAATVSSLVVPGTHHDADGQDAAQATMRSAILDWIADT